MSPPDRPPPGTPAALMRDLRFAAERRLPRMFTDVAADRLKYQTLAKVIEDIRPELWAEDPTRALLVTMREAIDELPSTKAREGFAERCTWQVVARILYFGSEVDENLRTYSEYRQSVEEISGYHWNVSKKDLVRFTNEIRERLAEKLFILRDRAIRRREKTHVALNSEPESEQILIDRPEYVDRLQALVDAGHKVICIWGEPGIGKSTLAEQFARQFAGDTPPLIIHCAPLVTAITPEAETFGRDLVNALAAEGVDSTKVSQVAWFSELCKQLAGQPRSGAVVLDNIETNEYIEQVVLARPKIPVLITMRERLSECVRERLSHSEIACEELGNFTESQAREFIRHHLPDENDEDANALAHALGCRPLALEHAVRFVREFPDVSLKTLVHGLVTKVTDTLSAMTPFEELERSLARLYGLIVASLEQHVDARTVLDSFLAVVGGTGNGYREIVYLFMQSEVGGSHDRLHFRSGLRELGRLGLVRERHGVIPRKLEESGYAGRSPTQLVMHALTYNILRDLRGPKPLAVESRYWDWVLQGGHQALPEDDTNAHEHAYLALLQWSLRVASGGMPRGWASMIAADDRTWIALMEQDGGSEPAGTYVVRYAVLPNAVYKLDYRSGRWSNVEGQEATLLFLLITIYYERIHYQLQTERSLLAEEEPPEQPRLDDEVTPPDGYRHIIIEPLAERSYLVCHEWSLWALCGKRFMASSAEVDAEACPDCESLWNSAERLRDIEAALQSRYFTGLDYKDPVAAARLFLMRAKLRRELDRPAEAAGDLDHAYRFLLLATDAPEGDVLVLGLGVIAEAGRLPEPHRRLALPVYDHLLWRFKDQEAIQHTRARLQLERAKLLEWWGQAADALAGYRAIAREADAGQSSPPVNATMFNVLWEREHAERKLGLTDDANKTMRRVIAEAERERGEGRLLIACLMYAGAGLMRENPRQAREDLQRALRIAGTQQPPDYENMWDCLIKLSNIELMLGSPTGALEDLELALEIARNYLPQRVQQTEQAIVRVRGAGS